ncbi:2-polyprenylphenol hydroxylase-like oxidoreductase (plasmid) [Mycolicibacterium chubuense NBB4]|uniref:2-polyprenylphenol hydroxylase-like oxidoreductase n=1 Tax=Mycolicibacterium chubuense (strain NBB4) TaxID=710421 RepID=D2K2E7_MYCCN|nr:2Fe-2S iron-sulfur cluster binding domain-containing protein [Mycolicibacterium chubuense]ACZ56353.1 putative propene monooxygenase reductase [Mycolicibacterium chubuense NBB4]AFM20131.1 2-polyprenylphenol hydroxylase-like oxidoreductase [Mycolicibacterium chubuense NBB4]
MASIKVEPFSHEFVCEDGETLLEGALRNGLLLKYGCKHGGCGTCKVRLVDGDVAEQGPTFALSAEDQANDLILPCSSIPLEPCVIDVETSGLTEDEFFSGDTSRGYDAVLGRFEVVAGDIARVRLDLGDDEIAFTAGQFVNVEVPGTGLLRTFSLANCPADSSVVELICKQYTDGLFARFLRDADLGTPIRLFGPYGSLKVHLSHRPIIMIAGGSGLAPLLSMLRDLAAKGSDRSVTLYFGARSEGHLYALDDITDIGCRLPDFEFVPVLSESWSPNWTGETGMVIDAILRRHTTLAHDVYLCGPPPMIDGATPLLLERGVRQRNIYYDAFTPATQTVPS